MSKPEETRLDTVHHMADKLYDSIERIKAALKNPDLNVDDLAVIENAITEFKAKIESVNPA